MGRPPLKKGAIERSALELFVEKGVDGTSIRDIAQRAGVTEGALYRHHRSKDDLVRHLFFENYEAFAVMIREVDSSLPFKIVIPKLIKAFFEYYDRDPPVFQFVMVVRHKLLEDVRADEKNPVELLSRIISKAVKSGEIPKQNGDLTTQLMLGMVMQTAVGLYYGRLKGKLSSYSNDVSRYCLLLATGEPVSDLVGSA